MADPNENFPEYPIPPANFHFLVESVLMQAQIQLGLLHLDPEDKDREPNLPMARHSIDMLAMLQEKTKGNLSLDEQRLVENGLTELRFRYVQVADDMKKKKQHSSIETPAVETPPDDAPRIITADGGKGTKTI